MEKLSQLSADLNNIENLMEEPAVHQQTGDVTHMFLLLMDTINIIIIDVSDITVF